MTTHGLSCEEAKKQDLVEYLAHLGHTPHHIKNNEYWYLSPLRKERSPSFKVNRRLNIWYDHGIGKGGTIVDFGILYHHCTISEFLRILDRRTTFTDLSKSPGQAQPKEVLPSPIHIRSVRSIDSTILTSYLASRYIPLLLAHQYCRQVDFELYGKHFSALGFQNQSGGFELRNPYFKGCTHPKDFSYIATSGGEATVFEGFFSFLSYLAIRQQILPPTNFLILNSLALLDRAKPHLEKHALIDLHLDNDASGKQSTKRALQWGTKYRDQSHLFSPYKDWNDYLIATKQHLQQAQKRGLRR